MTEELLPCPFCASTDINFWFSDKHNEIFCQKCTLTMHNTSRERFNTRPIETKLREDLETSESKRKSLKQALCSNLEEVQRLRTYLEKLRTHHLIPLEVKLEIDGVLGGLEEVGK